MSEGKRMRESRIIVTAASLVILLFSLPAPLRAEDALTVMKWLLDARSICAGQGGGALEALYRLKGKHAETSDQSLILIRQPLWRDSVLVLVHDPVARGKEEVEVEVFESGVFQGSEPDFSRVNPFRSALKEAYPRSGIFLGSVDIVGSHGTCVRARYVPSTGDGPKVAETFMAFH